MTISGDDVPGWLHSLSDGDLSERRKAAERRKAKAEQALARLGVNQRKVDTRRKIVLGGAIIAAARRDSSFAARLRSLLEAELQHDRDRRLFGLDPLPSNALPTMPVDVRSGSR